MENFVYRDDKNNTNLTKFSHMFQLFDQGGRYYHVMHARYTIFAISDNPMAREKYCMDGKKMELGVGEFACYRGEGVEEKDNVKNTEFLCRGTFSSRILFFFSFFLFYSYFVECCCCLCSWKTEPPRLSGTKKKKGDKRKYG